MNIFKRIAALEERMEKLESRVSELEFSSTAHSHEFGIIDFKEYVWKTSRDIAKIQKLEQRISALESGSKIEKTKAEKNWERWALKNNKKPL